MKIACWNAPDGRAVGSDKYAYKLDWLSSTKAFIRDELVSIAPEDRDVFRQFEQPEACFSGWDCREAFAATWCCVLIIFWLALRNRYFQMID